MLSPCPTGLAVCYESSSGIVYSLPTGYSAADSLNAGLDLEMPGVNKFRSQYHTAWSVHARKVTLETIKKRARRVLELVQKCAKGAPEASFYFI